jgi:predicted ester cyclase
MADMVRVYQEGADGRWEIEEMFSVGDRVVVRWTGSGTHIGEVHGIPATGKGPGRRDLHPPAGRRQDR